MAGVTEGSRLRELRLRVNPDLPMTLCTVYREGVTLFLEAGIANAANEVMWILEVALGISRLALYTDQDRIVDQEGWKAAMRLLVRRASGEPLQYLLGTQEFWGLEFAVRPGVFIPRPETELIVEEVLSYSLPSSSPLIVDVGTGPGCLAVALAVGCPHGKVYAIDRCPLALAVAKENAERHRVTHRVTFLFGDLLQPLAPLGLECHISAIVANPPYLPTSQLETLPREVRDFEPRLALDGGSDGLEPYRRLLREALIFLEPGGILVVEVGAGQAAQACKEALGLEGFLVRGVRRDSAGIERVICLERRGQRPS